MEVNASRFSVGDTASHEFVVTDEDVDAFARLSADTNPLHMDAKFASELGYPRRVAHGMLALSAISKLIGTQLPGPGSLWVSQELQFVAPVLVGDSLIARVTVVQVSKATRMVALSTEVANRKTGTTVLSGSAKVILLQRKAPAEGQH